MNVNVVVLNVHHEFGDPVSKPFKAPLNESIEEVVELVPHNGIWGSSVPADPNAADSRRPRFAHPSPTPTRYDQKGKVQYSLEDKGLRINITA
jgi:hypothetical protein